jgi:hemolysin activation/secretion protein
MFVKSAGARVGGLGLLLALAGTAHAQVAAEAVPPGGRTGPEAKPPELPRWSEPKNLPLVPPAAEPGLPTAAAGRLSAIVVRTEGEAGGGVPPPQWRPPSTGASGLSLEHRPGEALDGDWVRRQFALNGLPEREPSVSAAVALIQLINRALVTAGFVNSGLLVSGRPAADGVLEVDFVQGRLTAGAGGAPILVEFADGDTNSLGAEFIRRRFPSANAQPLSAYAIERDFRLLAENPAIGSINTDLRPGTRPGEASLHVVIDPARRGGITLGYANDRSPSVGSERLSAGGFLRNFLTDGDLLTGELGYTSGVEDAQLAYTTPFQTPQTLLTLRGSFNNAAVIDRPLLPLDIRAEDRAIEGGFLHRLIEEPLMPGTAPGQWRPSRTLTTGLLIAYRHQRSFLFGQPFSFAPGSVNGRTEYWAARLTGDYVVRGVDQVLALSATASLGLDGTQSRTPGVLNPDRHFVVGLVQANYARRLGPPGLELRGRLAGQLASSILYSGERLSIGGQSSVRGYRENIFLVDKGAIGSAELAWSFSLTEKAKRRPDFDPGAFSVSGFVDAAVAGTNEGPQPPRRFIAGVGASLAWTPSDALRIWGAKGFALHDVPRSGSRDLQDRGWHFRVTVDPLRLFRRRGASPSES